jgi:hypothetical protein
LGLAYLKTSGCVTSLSIGKTWYQGGMVFNTKVHTRVDALAYPYTPTQHWCRGKKIKKWAENLWLPALKISKGIKGLT